MKGEKKAKCFPSTWPEILRKYQLPLLSFIMSSFGKAFQASTFALHKQKYSAYSQPFFCLLTLAKKDLLSAINCDGVRFLRLYREEGEEPGMDSP